MTRQLLIAKYGSETLADEVIDNKLADPEVKNTQVKAHPDFPHNKSMTLYLCWDNESETSKDRTIMDSTHTSRDESPRRRKRSRSASSEYSASEEDSAKLSKAVAFVRCAVFAVGELFRERIGRTKRKKGKSKESRNKRGDKRKQRNKGEKKRGRGQPKNETEKQKEERLKKKQEREETQKKKRDERKAWQDKIKGARKVPATCVESHVARC